MENNKTPEMMTKEEKKKQAQKRARLNRKMKDELMRSCGLVKVRGSVSGRIYWE